MVEIAKLRQIHEQDVKDCAIYSDMLFTVGRDGRLFVVSAEDLSPIWSSRSFGCFANSVGVLENLVYVGLQNGTVKTFAIREKQLEEIGNTNEHKENVCFMKVSGNQMISTSWDGKICVWADGKILETVKMEKAVWCADTLKNQKKTLVVGCTDGSLVYFERKEGKYSASKGIMLHSSCIRDLLVEDNAIVSLSNTGVVIVSDYSGRVLKKKDLDLVSFRIEKWMETEGYVVSSDEGVVCVLDKELNVSSSINLPVLSCWCAKPALDRVMICGSDGRVYVFGATGSEEGRQELRKLQDRKEEEGKADREDGDVREDMEGGKGSGTKDAKTDEEQKYKVVDGQVYEKRAGVWELFGNQITEEKKDHTVNIELGTRTFKLSFNKNEEYKEVAKSFVEQYKIGAEYTEEIVEFLNKNFPQKKNKNIEEYCVYRTIAMEGVVKKIEPLENSKVVVGLLEDLESGRISPADKEFKERSHEVEVVLSEWMEEPIEKFPILDCYKYLVAKEVQMNFLFMKDLDVFKDKRDAVMYVKVATNVLAFAPEQKNLLAETVNRIIDRRLVGEEVAAQYKKNLYLSENKTGRW